MISIGGPKTISLWFSGRSRGTAMGIYTTGNWIGGLIALALTNSLVMPLVGNNWRLTFVVYGLTTFAVALQWFLLARGDERVEGSPTSQIIEVFGRLSKIRNVRILLIMGLFAFAIGHGFSSWLPKILEVSGMSASVVFQVEQGGRAEGRVYRDDEEIVFWTCWDAAGDTSYRAGSSGIATVGSVEACPIGTLTEEPP